MIKVSIVTICYNNERDIRPTLESVVNQSYPNIEYIVIDGASKDNSLSIINEYRDKISILVSEPDQGMYEALNKGFSRATGDVIGMIHAGDRLYDNEIVAKIAKFYEEHPEVDLSYGNSIIVDANDVPRRVNTSPSYSPRLPYWGWMPSHQSIYCRKKVFETAGYYRTDQGGGGDYEWFVRAFVKHQKDFKIHSIDEFIIKFSLGGQSTTNVSQKFSLSRIKKVHNMWKMNGLRPPFALVIKMFSRKFKQFALARKRRKAEEKIK